MFLLYGGYYILVFHLKQILAGIGVFLLRNLLLWLLCLDLSYGEKWHKKWIFFGILLLFLLLVSILPMWNLQNILAVFFSVLSIPFLVYAYQKRLLAYRKFYAWSYFSEGNGWLMIFFTLIFGFALLGNFQQLPFSCEQVQGLNQHFYLFSQEKGLVPDSKVESWLWHSVLAKLQDTKGFVWDNIVETQKELNRQICLSLYEQLAKLYVLPAFQLGFLLVFYMLSYGVMRFILKLISAFGVSLFWGLQKLWCYQSRVSLAPIEELY